MNRILKLIVCGITLSSFGMSRAFADDHGDHHDWDHGDHHRDHHDWDHGDDHHRDHHDWDHGDDHHRDHHDWNHDWWD